MAKKIRLKLNNKGISELLRSKEVRSDLEERGDRIKYAAGVDGIETQLTFTDRAAVFIRTDTLEAMRAEATDRVLTKALDAGR